MLAGPYPSRSNQLYCNLLIIHAKLKHLDDRDYNLRMSMRKQVLFLQGGGAGAFHEDRRLAESLSDALGSAYQVHYPAMPHEDDPDYELWRQKIEPTMEQLGDGVLLCGHSVGAYILLKLLVERQATSKPAGIFLIATPFVGTGGWQIMGMALPEDAAANLPRNVPLFFYHARDDETVPFAHLALYRQKLPHAVTRELEQGGHQLNNDLSVVAADIERVVGGRQAR